jgi:hypothetical protein
MDQRPTKKVGDGEIVKPKSVWISAMRTVARRLGVAVGALLSIYLVARALVELFVIDMTDPGTYRDDWGGPSLAGVLLVHCGPGVLAIAVWAAVAVRRRNQRMRGHAAANP